MKHIPNIFTLFNLFFGCLAIVCILQNGIVIQYNAEDAQSIVDIPERIAMASVFMGLAAVVDFLDGFVARLLKVSSELGKQLDSLADVVSFGVAPSLIVYQFLRMSFAREEDGLMVSAIWLAPAFILAMAAAYRLGKFNLDESQQYGFKGVPTPAMGLLIASFPLIYWYNPVEWVQQLLLNRWFWYGMIAVLSGLMISSLPLMALKFKSGSRLAENSPKLFLIAAAIILGILFHWLAVPMVFILYILLSLIFKNKPA
ncbi:MAG TPA: CDP-alcohol phosphatidyltransferase family protein [Ferruginibacter sp.]|nr:CDP-alcohol phosphatidyltransferase family protein [Ferruginibacter sp.]